MSTDRDDDIKIHGPLRRNAPLLLGVLVTLAVGPMASHSLETYRGVVLERRDNQALVGFESRPPKWISGIHAEPGSILQKERFTWDPQVVPAEPQDHPLTQLHARYSHTYEGVVIHIHSPRTAGGPYVALVQLEDGSKLNVPLHGAHLSPLQVGNRVRKDPGSWEPHIVDAGVDNRVTPSPPKESPSPPQGNPSLHDDTPSPNQGKTPSTGFDAQ